jgi:Adenylate cyclase, class 2 (thermophilic)
MHINFEFKAQSENNNRLEEIIISKSARFIGTDHQIDTYFNVHNGRLKLREGTIEHALIYYKRENTAGLKQSDVLLYQHNPDPTLKLILTNSLGIKVVVDKIRKIYFVDNVKIHFDDVKDLGSFVEVEAIDRDGTLGLEKIKNQCEEFRKLLNIQNDQFKAESYSDLLVKKSSPE